MRNLVGQILLNQYRVESFVAAGGMGSVYRVWDDKRNVYLALKTLHSDLADDPQVFKRFQREAQALKRLHHPHIVPYYGMYQDHGEIFLLEAFIDGWSLQEILREHKSGIPLTEALRYMKAICAALGYAHQQGIVHCDIKPANIMVSHTHDIYLTDFGIAKFVGGTTTSTFVAGTPAYMAPEQIRGRGIVPATDVYALGVMLFEMLTGQRPFRGTEPETAPGGDTSSDRIRYGHLKVPPPDPSKLKPEISPAVAAVILRSLAKSPHERYASPQELLLALFDAVKINVAMIPMAATLTGQDTPSYDSLQSKEIPFPVPNLKTRKQSKGILTAIVLFLLIFILSTIWFVAAKQSPPSNLVGATLTAFSILQTTTFTEKMDTPKADYPTGTSTPILILSPQISPTPTIEVATERATSKSSTNSPTIELPPGPAFQPDNPEGFIEWYFDAVCSNRDYPYLWQFMTEAFKAKNSPGGYDEYKQAWEANERVEIKSITHAGKIQDRLKYKVDMVIYYKRAGYKPQPLLATYYLAYDNNQGHWLFDRPDIP